MATGDIRRKALLKRSGTAATRPSLNTINPNNGIGVGELAINYSASDVVLYTVKDDVSKTAGDSDKYSVCNVIEESKLYKYHHNVNNDVISIDRSKRWQVIKISEKPNDDNLWELSITEPADNGFWGGTEVHCIIENNTEEMMTVTIPDTYKSFSGYTFGIIPDGKMEANIYYDGTYYYVRATSEGSIDVYTVQSELDRGVYKLVTGVTISEGDNPTNGYSVLEVQEEGKGNRKSWKQGMVQV